MSISRRWFVVRQFVARTNRQCRTSLISKVDVVLRLTDVDLVRQNKQVHGGRPQSLIKMELQADHQSIWKGSLVGRNTLSRDCKDHQSIWKSSLMGRNILSTDIIAHSKHVVVVQTGGQVAQVQTGGLVPALCGPRLRKFPHAGIPLGDFVCT